MAKQIIEITDEPKQLFTITTDNGDSFKLDLSYSVVAGAWFYNLTFGDIVYNGRKIVNAPNIIRTLRNILPFGVSISVTDEGEPIFLDDFTSGRVALYILESSEVQAIETEFYN